MMAFRLWSVSKSESKKPLAWNPQVRRDLGPLPPHVVPGQRKDDSCEEVGSFAQQQRPAAVSVRLVGGKVSDRLERAEFAPSFS